MKSKTHIVIPDAHVSPGQNLDRFHALRNLMEERKPDAIINIGDGADIESLSNYTKKGFDFNKCSYHLEIQSSRKANDILFSKAKRLPPVRKYCLGNHEERINKYKADHPELGDFISVNNLDLAKWWDVVPFLHPCIVDNICYSHYFVSGVMGKAIGGESPARSILNKNSMSSVSGHSHTRDFAESAKADGGKICSLVVGCFFEDTPEYAHSTAKLWWRGIVVLNNVVDGSFDPEFISIDTLKSKYL